MIKGTIRQLAVIIMCAAIVGFSVTTVHALSDMAQFCNFWSSGHHYEGDDVWCLTFGDWKWDGGYDFTALDQQEALTISSDLCDDLYFSCWDTCDSESDIDFRRLVVPGLDEPAFRGCVDGKAQTAVQRDISEARSLGIRGTPSFIFGILDGEGGLEAIRRESGAIPFERIAAILDELSEDRAGDQSARR
jgi:hypothetical protein